MPLFSLFTTCHRINACHLRIKHDLARLVCKMRDASLRAMYVARWHAPSGTLRQ